MEKFTYPLARAHASHYGLWVGGVWIAAFFCSIAGLERPVWANMGLLFSLYSIYLVVRQLRTFRRTVAPLTFFHAWWMGWQVMLFAALLAAAAHFVYFRFFDGGYLVNTYMNLLQQPEVRTPLTSMYPDMNIDTFMEDLQTMLENLTPIQFTFQILFFNLFVSLLLSFPVALFARWGRQSKEPTS